MFQGEDDTLLMGEEAGGAGVPSDTSTFSHCFHLSFWHPEAQGWGLDVDAGDSDSPGLFASATFPLTSVRSLSCIICL